MSFREEIVDPGRFIVTLELVPGPESRGRSVDTVKAIAQDAAKDGRVSAVSITDNPGGNPALSPDVLGREILDLGLDVIVHCTCRDANRAGLESRGLQLARMGLTNILALTGDYSSSGFGGQGLPVFDLDSVTLICLLHAINERLVHSEAPAAEGHAFLVGCAVSPFKWTEPECFAQYAKLKLKTSVGADFVISQLGYDARKFDELLRIQRHMGIQIPTLGTVYVLTPGAARYMHAGNVPGAVVPAALMDRVAAEPGAGAAIERTARLVAVLRGLGYRGVHLGGVHRSFGVVDRVLSRATEIGENWPEFVSNFDYPQPNGFYVFRCGVGETGPAADTPAPRRGRCGFLERVLYQLLRGVHHILFRLDAPISPFYARVARLLDRRAVGRFLLRLVEDPVKFVLFACKRCGDCALPHLAYLCPESQCPKHLRNGACGGSADGQCEVHPERACVWVRVYNRLAATGHANDLCAECIPPRLWVLDQSSAWLNFHLRRDHQSLPCEIAQMFASKECPQTAPEDNRDRRE